MADAQCTVMRGRFGAPGIDKLCRVETEFESAVGIANAHDRAVNALTLGAHKFEPAITGVGAGEDGDRTMFHAKFDRNA